MTKKQNTIVFIVVGTIVNIVLTLFFICALTVAGVLLFKEHMTFVLPVCLIGGIVLGMLVYQKTATFVIKRYNLEDKLDPLFSRRHARKPRD